jgi:hypothetical protein
MIYTIFMMEICETFYIVYNFFFTALSYYPVKK